MDTTLQDLSVLEASIRYLQLNDAGGFYSCQVVTQTLDHGEGDIHVKYLKRVIVIPSMSVQIWKVNPFKFASADAAHLENVFGGVIQTIGCMDGEKRRITLILAITPVENKENWEWVLSLANEHVFQNDIHMLMSDRDKGLQSADWILRGCVHTHCSVHLARNFGLGNAAGYAAMSALAKAPTEGAYTSRLSEVCGSDTTLRRRIEEVADSFVTAKLLQKFGTSLEYKFITNYGVTSNNISEQENFGLNCMRNLPYTEGLLAFLRRLETLANDRRQTLKRMHENNAEVVPWVLNAVVEGAKELRSHVYNVVYRSSSESGRVFTSWDVRQESVGGKSVTYPVQLFPLAERWVDRIKCSCNYFVATGYPCKHASLVLSYCAATADVGKGFLSSHIRADNVRNFFRNMGDPRWYAPAYHVRVNMAMYEGCPPSLPSLNDLHLDARNNLLLPFPHVSKRPGSKKQVQKNQQIASQIHNVRLLTEYIDEKALPDDLWHQYMIFQHLHKDYPDRHVQCSICNLLGHRADSCKQAQAATAVRTSAEFLRRLDYLIRANQQMPPNVG